MLYRASWYFACTRVLLTPFNMRFWYDRAQFFCKSICFMHVCPAVAPCTSCLTQWLCYLYHLNFSSAVIPCLPISREHGRQWPSPVVVTASLKHCSSKQDMRRYCQVSFKLAICWALLSVFCSGWDCVCRTFCWRYATSKLQYLKLHHAVSNWQMGNLEQDSPRISVCNVDTASIHASWQSSRVQYNAFNNM